MGKGNQKSFERKKCWGGMTTSLFFQGKGRGRNSFISTDLYTFAVKNKGSQMGNNEFLRRKRTAEKNNERQSEKERITY